MGNQEKQRPIQTTRLRWSRRIRKGFVYAFLLYVGVLAIGLIPVNNSFLPTRDGVRIYLVSSAVHADLILPIRNDGMDWSKPFSKAHFRGDVAGQTHVAVGWGDKGFYLETAGRK